MLPNFGVEEGDLTFGVHLDNAKRPCVFFLVNDEVLFTLLAARHPLDLRVLENLGK